ncbi:unnamed protein product [Ophioblennius macclurei]
MDSQDWLESSLQRSASLGLDVLARASRRSVDWTSTSTRSSASPTTDQHVHTSTEKTPPELIDAFATIADFMEQTSYQCKRFYDAGYCTQPSEIERKHKSRFHTRLGDGTTHPALPPKTHSHSHRHNVEAPDDDYYIEVAPGIYSITARMPESQQQTHQVNLKAGESVSLTFNF